MFNPWFSQSQQFAEPFQRAAKEQARQWERAATLGSEAQQAAFERTSVAFDESTKLARASLGYLHDLAKACGELQLSALRQLTGRAGEG